MELLKFEEKEDDVSDINVGDIEAFRKIHPIASKDLSDKEIKILGDMIDKKHNDKSPLKFFDVTQNKGVSYVIWIDEDGTKSYDKLEVKGA